MTGALGRRLPAVVIGAALLATAACGSGSSGSASGPVTLSFLSYNYGTADLGGEGTQELIDAFEHEHPDIHIKPRGVAVKDTLTSLRTAVAAGTPDDVAQVGWSKMAEAYQALPVVPVQSIPSRQEWQSAVAGMNPAVMKATARDGQTVAMPYTMSIPTLFYNDDLFRRAGLDPAAPPTTMDQLQAAALKIHAATGAAGVYVDAANASKSDFLTQSLINSNGGSVVADNGTTTVDSPAAVSALGVLGGLTSSGAQPAVSEDDALAAFKSGNLGMLVTSTAVLAGLDKAAAGKFHILAAGMPGFGTKPPRPTYSGAGLIVLSKDKAKQQAAWQFVRFLTSAQAFTTITEKIGYLPLRPAVVDDPHYLGDYFAKDPRLRPALRQLDDVSPYRFFPGPKANESVVALQDQAVAPIMLQGADPRKALSTAAATIRSLVGK